MPGIQPSSSNRNDDRLDLQSKIQWLENEVRKLREAINKPHVLEVKPDEPLALKPHIISEDITDGKYLRTDGKEAAYFDDAQADEVVVDASGFTGNLSGTDTDVQTALDTVDGLTIGTGDVVGPASAIDDRIATFDGITGKLIQDGGKVIADLELAGTAAAAVSSHEGTYAHGDIALNSGHRTTVTGNPHSVTKTDVGLGNVTNDAQEILANKNAASGYAGLDAASKLTGSQQVYGTLANTACEGNDARLSDARTPTAHNTSHQSGGSDAIKLDDLAAPDDNTDLNASTAKHGLLPKLSNVVTEFLNGQGGWTTPSGGDVTGPASSTDGNLAAFDGATGKLLKDSGKAYPSGTIVGTSDTQTLTNKTLTSPKITEIRGSNNKAVLKNTDTSSGVNFIEATGADTGNAVSLAAGGTDTNVGIVVSGKGAGMARLVSGSVSVDVDSAGKIALTGGHVVLDNGEYVQVGSDAGIDDDINFVDNGGSSHSITIRGGVIVGWTVT